MYVLGLVLVVVISVVFSSIAFGASKAESIILTTMDVKDTYEVIGMVSSRTTATDFNTLIKEVKKTAKNLNADAVVGIRCFSYGDYMYAYGTAVKFK